MSAPKFPTPFQKKTLWNAVTGISLLILAALIVGALWLGINIIGLLQPVLIPVAIAGVIAYLLDPVVQWLVKKRKWSRVKSVSIVFAAGLLILGGLIASVVPATIRQGNDLWEQRQALVNRVKGTVQEYVEDHPDSELLEWFQPRKDAQSGAPLPSEAEQWFRNNMSKISSGAWNILSSGFRGASAFFGIALGICLVPIYLWFFLIEADPISKQWHDYIPLRASKAKDEIVGTLQEINGYLISFFRGQMLVSMIDGALVGIALTIIGLPYGLIIGFFVGVLGLIPYLGNLLCLVPAMIIAAVHFSNPANQWEAWPGDTIWMYPLIVAALFFIVQQINGFVTAPKIVGDSVGLHPMTVIFSVFFWSFLIGGVLGAILAVPLTASLKVLFRRYIWEARLNKEKETEATPAEA
ncbi:AI-2E family transporter [Sulfuriroseicoccus oceanibius]|uniref:AI-2E family transporter n=1 Tax=Sulfuriroseicoccus oceanibius TaxID=2707525 RepID=A0A7T7JBK3_9BACT|nr:AI-2E family transporter [Sulfuriroseicoccus oceanibius]QQL44290.1 AI-2E family transporter [Sulfuriroseicoccus oceanibius]